MLSNLRQVVLFLFALLLSACVAQDKKTENKQVNKPTDQVVNQPSELQKHQRHLVRHLAGKDRRLVMAEADLSASVAIMPPQPPGLPMRSRTEPNLAGEKYATLDLNPIKVVAENPVSTFSIDVDTGAYSNMRRVLNQGILPTKDAIRTEELLNYFDYSYQAPDTRDKPFQVNYAMLQAPWNKHKQLLQIGIKAWEPAAEIKRPDANLVFLIDVSGSMHSADKLPLLKKSLRMLTKQMTSRDKISIVVYAGASGVILKPTPATDLVTIEQALSNLQAGGSTNGEAGIKQAYALAHSAFIENGINRILLATDGDFNVGLADTDRLVELVSRERDRGVALSTLGFGTGNYNDHLMEQLANKGNGSYSYIDSLLEARKVLVEELDSQLVTVAKDVKIQLEFNPERVREYRLIGYENRILAREDFNNDQVDAGEIGSGHTVTAIYELTLTESEHVSVEPLRYQQELNNKPVKSHEFGFIKIRYKEPEASTSLLISEALTDQNIALANSSADIRFAAG